KNKINKLFFFEIEDKFFEKRLTNFLQKNNLDFSVIQSPMFLSTRQDYKKFSQDKNVLLMKNYYQLQRKKLKFLMEDGKPFGGKWSFDEENRKKLPKKIDVPALPKPDNSKYEGELKKEILKHFNHHPGNVDNRWMPVTRKAAREWLSSFFEERLSNFGFYEDAVSSEHNFMFHSTLSPMLNIGLITPLEVLQSLEKYFEKVPLNSYEGFLRQIIGWREFIRGIYQEKSDVQETSNFFSHTRKLNSNWYSGKTKLKPLDDAINFTLKFGYSHHINRLMIIANIMNLSGIHPKEIYNWFMEMYVDSSDWVMVPNVYGMATFADGGIMSTKPYICGSNYILKMSDYKKGDWCDTLDGLYWRFVDNNKVFLGKNPRLSLMVNALNKIESERKKNIFKQAELFIENNTDSQG
ncbi:MAG: cryptochrome/photolyase family protein, partial [Betaproteobacteria bacterium TMED41]